MKSYGKVKKTELANNITEVRKGISGSVTSKSNSHNLYQQLRDSEEKSGRDMTLVTSCKVEVGALISKSYDLQKYSH